MKTHLSSIILLLIALVCISFLYNYPDIWTLPAQGAHVWRQSDCVAMTLNYHQFDLPFLEPACYNLQSDGGRVAGEFPVFYFIAAQFDKPLMALRVMHTLLLFGGIIAVYFIAFHFLQRRLLSLFCSIIVFTSPLLVFYGNNFLTDVPALSAVWIGWALFLPGIQREKPLLVFSALLFFTLGALLKASQTLQLVILAALLLHIGTQRARAALVLMTGGFLLVGSWYIFAREYNQTHHDSYYFLSVAPIWKLSLYEMGLGIWRMVISFSKNYFWRPTSIVLLLSCFYLIRNWKNLDSRLRTLITGSIVVTLFYILAFYQKIIGHEYYTVFFFTAILFIMIGIIKVYNRFHAENVFTHAFMFLFILANVFYCRSYTAEKLQSTRIHPVLADKGMQDFMVRHGVTSDKHIVSIPDASPNITLSQLQRKGYTNFNFVDSLLQQQQIDFIVCSDTTAIAQWQPYLKEYKGNYNGIYLYRTK